MVDPMIVGLVVLASGLYTLGVFGAGWFSRRYFVGHQRPHEVQHGQDVCDFPGCDTPIAVNAIPRAIDRKRMCAKHKASA